MRPNCGLDGEKFQIPQTIEAESIQDVIDIEDLSLNFTIAGDFSRHKEQAKLDIDREILKPLHLENLKSELVNLRKSDRTDEENEKIKSLLVQIETIRASQSENFEKKLNISNNYILDIILSLCMFFIMVILTIFAYKLYITRLVVDHISSTLKESNKKIRTLTRSLGDGVEMPLLNFTETRI